MVYKIRQAKLLIRLHVEEKQLLQYNELQSVYHFLENNTTATYFLGFSLDKMGHSKEGLFYMEKGFSKCVAPKIGTALAYKHMDLKNYNRAEEILRFNTGTEPFRYAPKMDLLYFYKKTKNNEEQIKIAKEIMEFPVKIPSKKIDTYKKECRVLVNKLLTSEKTAEN